MPLQGSRPEAAKAIRKAAVCSNMAFALGFAFFLHLIALAAQSVCAVVGFEGK